MWEKTKKITASFLNSIFFYVALLFIGLALIFYFVLGRGAAEELIHQTQQRELGVVETGASSIQTFFDLLGKSMVLTAKREGVVSGNPQLALNDFKAEWDDQIDGILFLDKEGTIRYLSAVNTLSKGESLGDRDYFQWAKTAKLGTYYVGTPVLSRAGASEGHYIVVVATPVYDASGNFNGALAASVEVSVITEKYLKPLSFLPSSRVVILDTDGTFFSGVPNEVLGTTIYEYLEKYPFTGSRVINNIVAKRLNDNKPDTSDVVIPKNPPNPVPLERSLLASAPVTLNQNHWIIAMRISANDALSVITPFYLRQLAVFLITFIVLLAIFVRFSKEIGFKEGFVRHARLHKESEKEIEKEEEELLG